MVEVGSAGGVVVVSVLTTILSVCPCMDVCVYSLRFYSCRSVVPLAVLDYPEVASSDSRAKRSCATVGFQASQPMHELSTYFYLHDQRKNVSMLSAARSAFPTLLPLERHKSDVDTALLPSAHQHSSSRGNLFSALVRLPRVKSSVEGHPTPDFFWKGGSIKTNQNDFSSVGAGCGGA